ncbi:TetR family transcriptional regulator [Niallia sp. 01092]|uniref:TetR family transcriptional regulator n=1 Tax=unclassified Niallia TaxID=2837522 RepID=UPI003FD4CA89
MISAANDKYNKILQSAIEVISEKGLDKTSISDIVKKAGVAQGTFYLYFRSKNALIPAIAENLLTLTLDRIKEKAQGKDSFWSMLTVFINEIYHNTDEHKDVLVLCYSGLAIDYSMEIWEAIYQPFYQWFEDILNKAIEKKEIIGDIHVKWTAKMIINLVENAAERFYIGRDQDVTLEQSQDELFRFLKRSLLLKGSNIS